MAKFTNLSFILILIVSFFFSLKTHGQVYYDDWPITRKSNDRSKDNSIVGKDEFTPNFVPIGTKWNHRIISYFFNNGTDDIAANNEQQAIRDGFALWAAQTDLAFIEVCNAIDADIVISWGTYAHGDPTPPCTGGVCDFDGVGGILAHNLGGATS